MNLSRRLLPLFISLLALTAHAQAVAPARTVETVRFESKLVGRALPYNVVLPIDYHAPEQKMTRYPALYLLHGFTGSYDDWLKRTRLADYAKAYRMIVVTPEGENSWYTDSAGVPRDKFETYIIEELIPDVQKRFRTVEARAGRAVAGLSMGGYGALKFGVKYPDKFALAASMSGAVGAASWRDENDLAAASHLRHSLLQTFGGAGHPTKAANDLFRLVRELPAERLAQLPFFYFDIGTEDALRLLAPNRALADLFVERKIPHEYRQLPGGHNWRLWDQQVQEVLRLAVRKMSEPALEK
ncbi:MAG: esterase family protein [Acidobacteriota bacterium]|nr:esterase family protein [Acidobacteriota bacterium]